MMSGRLEKPAAYIRRSTKEQEEQHQRQAIRDWLEYQGVEIGDVDLYAEQASGADPNRSKFQELLDAVQNGEVTDVVVWEISRIARKGVLAQEFFDACEENGVTIHVTDGAVRRVEPDGTGRMVAGIIAEVMAENRRQLIRRTKAGMKRAREEGKWVGNVPAGFIRTDDGYLKPNLDPDYDNEETGFFDIAEALEQIENGKSYNKAAEDTPNITRQALANIDQDEERRAWYLDGEAEDDRVSTALEVV